MILYHFTGMENVEAIQRDGLEKWVGPDADMVGGAVVWLCDTPTLEATEAEMEWFRQHHPAETFVSKRWFGAHKNEPMARFTIRLPSNDQLLKQYGSWVQGWRRLPDQDSVVARRMLDTWWVYFGNIPPSKIVEFIVEEAIPYWPAPA